MSNWYDIFFKPDTTEFNLGNLNLPTQLGLGALGLFGLNRLGQSGFAQGSQTQGNMGYQGGIPQLVARREALPMPVDPDRRPGSGGRRYFTDVSYEPVTAAQGGLMSLQEPKGYYLGGPTDGMADEVPAVIDGTQEARLSDGEFVIPADVVSHLGNGNSEAGARVLYDMMDRIRKARTGNPEQGRQINPERFLPTGRQ